ncbi:hypothetical protein KCU78_g17148, partial [Aureobasidium melanogenum]
MDEIYNYETITYKTFSELLDSYKELVQSKLDELEEQRLVIIPKSLSERTEDAHLKKLEVQKLVDWKLGHGTFRPSLRKLVESNADEAVEQCTREAFETYDKDNEQWDKVVGMMAKELRGVGPATASLLLNTYDGEKVPFFSDELYRWVMFSEGKGNGWDRKIKYSAKEYQELYRRVEMLRERLGKESDETITARRAPNVSQYIANLNTVPSAADLAAQQELGAFDDDLAMFTNTQFFDFDGDMPAFPDMPQQQFPANMQPDMHKPLDFGNANNFQFPDFSFQQSRPHTLPTSPPNGLAIAPSPSTRLDFPAQHAPRMAQPQPQAAFSQPSPQVGDKRKSTVAAMSSPADLEDESRLAAEEDKRRRNTAASARFRVKKKQREQALEKTAKEMSDKVQILEARVNQLEMENKWLKGLITEKNLKGPTANSETTDAKESESITESSKKGVGTDKEADKAVEA